MKKKAVLINPKFLPEANGVIACLKNVCPYFAEYFDLTIVTAKTVSGTKRYERMSDDTIGNDNNVEIIRISNIFDDLYVVFKELLYSKTEEEKEKNKSFVFRITNAINAKLMYFFEKLSKKYGVVCSEGYEKNFFKKFEKLGLDFDYLICPVMPRANAFVALNILEKHPGKEMIFLQLDMYSRNPNLKHIGRDVLVSEQKKFYDKSAVVAVQPGIMPYIEEDFSEYKQKIIPLHVPSLNKFSKGQTKDTGKELKIVYAGSFLETVRPPRPMFELLKNVCETNKNIKLHLLSWGCPEIVDEFKKLMGDNLILHGFLPMEEASVIIESADILINIGNTVQEAMPSKTFEYIGRRKPIIHFYFSEGDVGKSVLEDYPLKLFVDANRIQEMGTDKDMVDGTTAFICDNAGKLCDMEELKEKYACYTAKYYVDTIVNHLAF